SPPPKEEATVKRGGRYTLTSQSLGIRVQGGVSWGSPLANVTLVNDGNVIDGNVTLVNDEVKPLANVDSSGDHDSEDEVASVDNEMANFLASKKVGYGTNSLLEQWKETYENDDYDFDPYDDDMYEGQHNPDKIQAICDNLDIKVRGRKKK
ncbi:hypothetical protein Tco_1382202, partial [Tanacetum coccineum]